MKLAVDKSWLILFLLLAQAMQSMTQLMVSGCSLWCCAISFSLFICLLFILLGRRPLKKNKGIISKHMRTYPIVGNLPDFLKNRYRFLDWMTDILREQPSNTVIFRRPGKVQGVLTANPMNVEHMLKANFENYPKGERLHTLLKDFLGNGIFNSDGEMWKMQRKTASYEFNTKSLRNFIMEVVEKEIRTRLIPLLSQAEKTRQIIDIQNILERFAFDNICNVAFNDDPACLATSNQGDNGGSDLFRAFDDATNISAGRFMYAVPLLYKIKKFLNIGSERRLSESIALVHDHAMKIIKSRRERAMHLQNSSNGEDLLSRFMATDDGSDDQFLRDIVVSFILAGRDTTSSTLVWFFWLISSKPEVEQNIVNEIAKIRTHNLESKTAFTYDELREMHYLHASICEALRLYPPVPVNSRCCYVDDILPDGTFVGKGWFISYVTYAMGRIEGIWGEDCGSFKPERWLKDGVFQPESSYNFPVFHAGPRVCLGKEMAFIQMKSIVACVMERFTIAVADNSRSPGKVLALTMRMKDGLQVRVYERSSNKDKNDQ